MANVLDGFILIAPDRVSIMLDGGHQLCIHRADEGIVLDTFQLDPTAPDYNPDGEAVASTYLLDDVLIPDEYFG